tara:strand:+ start:502 stop:774 length:273 start_codon:yes stop_codon:yes gene_type:complete
MKMITKLGKINNMQLDNNRIGKAEIDELRGSIGEVFSDNHSGTLRSKLIGVSDDGLTAYVKEVKSNYTNHTPEEGIKEQPSWLAWNGMFY